MKYLLLHYVNKKLHLVGLFVKFKQLQFTVSHPVFCVLYTALLVVTYNAINIDKIAQWFVVGGAMDYGAFIAYLLAMWTLFIAFFVLFAHRFTTKACATLYIVLSAGASYFVAKYNIAVESSMVLNVLHTDTREINALLTPQMLPYLLLLVCVPLLILYKTRIRFYTTIKHTLVSCALFVCALVCTVGLLYAQFGGISKASNMSHRYILFQFVPHNYITGTLSLVQESVHAYYKKHKTPVVVNATQKEMPNLVVVLAIGEAARQKSFSLYGYQRNTNPLLSQQPSWHILNGNARLGSTILALREILGRDEMRLPAITNHVGIDTACYVNFSMYENCDAVGEVHVSNCGHGGDCYDEDVIPLLQKNLASYTSGSRFIVLHLGGGSHGPEYHHRYPPEYQRFTPLCKDADVLNKCSKQELFNAYDNSILYVDYVLSNINKKLIDAQVPYVLIYVADHGQSLLEGGYLFHGMPPGVALPPEQADVPLLVTASVPIQVDDRAVYPQPDIYDTILNLFAIETPGLKQERTFVHTSERQ